MRWPAASPIFIKEARTRIRGVRAAILLLVGAGIPIIIGLLVLGFGWSDAVGHSPGGMASNMAELGRAIFGAVMICELILFAFIVPGLTSDTFVAEQQRNTLEFLWLTRLSDGALIFGKLHAALLFSFLQFLCAIPVAATAFMLGGVSGLDVLAAVGVVVATNFFMGAAGLWCSCWAPNVAVARVASYAIGLGWVVVAPALAIMEDNGMFGHLDIPEIPVLGVLVPALVAYPCAVLIIRSFPAAWRATRVRPLATLFFMVVYGAGLSVAQYVVSNIPLVLDGIEGRLFGTPFYALGDILLGNSDWQDASSEQFASLNASLIAPLVFGACLLWWTMRQVHRRRRPS